MKLLLFLAIILPAAAQLAAPGTPLPRRPKPPVVFLNGYQSDCAGSNFAGTFGAADQVLAANGLASVFFNNCSISGRPLIEDLGRAFGQFLAALKYDDGSPVTTVDVVAHSMGGLIVRSYLSGKDASGAVFNPPVMVAVRKAVFLATPHFGTGIGAILGLDQQVKELSSGSAFLFDLATWNQGTDDLRGIDAATLIGNAGTGGGFLGLGTQPRFDDGVVALTSASLQFYMPGRTRVISACHTGPGLVTLAGLCPAGARGISDLESATDDNARFVLSFLAGTNEWQGIGKDASADEFLSANTGIMAQLRTADNQPAGIGSLSVSSKGTSKNLNVRESAYTDLIPAGPLAVDASSSAARIQKTVNVDPGGYAALTLKQGPFVSRVFPAAARVFPLTLAPGEIVSIYGEQLDQAQVSVNSQPVAPYYTSPTQLNAVLPEGLSGLVKLTVKSGTSSHTVNLMIEPAVPALFTQDNSGQGPASALNGITNVLVSETNPIRAGDYVSLYLTGLGATRAQNGLNVAVTQPTVTVGGKPCVVTYAGRAPLYAGLDQINCQIPGGLLPGTADVVVSSGARVSNRATLAVR